MTGPAEAESRAYCQTQLPPLWFSLSQKLEHRVSEKGKTTIAGDSNLDFVSAAVIREIRIKQALGKLEIPSNFREILNRESFKMLAISAEHAHAAGDLPAHHRDLFDRMPIAQAMVERYSIPVIKHSWPFGPPRGMKILFSC
jgi:PIN domain nuclease of toxin-antitoxin system